MCDIKHSWMLNDIKQKEWMFAIEWHVSNYDTVWVILDEIPLSTYILPYEKEFQYIEESFQ